MHDLGTELMSLIGMKTAVDGNLLCAVQVQLQSERSAAQRNKDHKTLEAVANKCPHHFRSKRWFTQSRSHADGACRVKERVTFIPAKNEDLLDIMHYFEQELSPKSNTSGATFKVTTFQCSFKQFYGSKDSVVTLYNASGQLHCVMRRHQAAQIWTCKERGPMVSGCWSMPDLTEHTHDTFIHFKETHHKLRSKSTPPSLR